MAEIWAHYQVLYEDGLPILYTGVNRFGTRVLGSLIEEHPRRGSVTFLHVPITDAAYVAFLSGRETYLRILQESSVAFVVERTGEDLPRMVIPIAPRDIPQHYLPAEDSYCPTVETSGASLEYVSKIDGPRASEHRAAPEAVAKMASKFPALLHRPLLHVVHAPTEVSTDVVALEAASFDMRFSVSITNQGLFPRDYSAYLRHYLQFCLRDFPAEASAVARHDTEEAPRFADLVSDFRESRFGFRRPDMSDDSVVVLAESIEDSAEAVTEIANLIGAKVTGIQIFNDLGAEQSFIGVIERTFADQYGLALQEYQEVAHRLEKDTEPKSYDILVYQLNRETRKGSAYVFGTSAKAPKASIYVQGDESLEESPYTASLHFSTRISVLGIGTRTKEGHVKHLAIVSAHS